jgi:ATP-dependent HslUV protease ATP-binding subunit HslU
VLRRKRHSITMLRIAGRHVARRVLSRAPASSSSNVRAPATEWARARATRAGPLASHACLRAASQPPDEPSKSEGPAEPGIPPIPPLPPVPVAAVPELGLVPDSPGTPAGAPSDDLTPARVVEELDRHIVGQGAAKRAMAVALRNRWRRLRLVPELRDEVMPKCVLLVGPTGVGKTEIARRMSKLVDAPFIKVEATKFTEVGFHGRDVDQIIRDLLEHAITLVRNRQRRLMAAKIERVVEDRILDELMGKAPQGPASKSRDQFRHLLRSGALDHQVIDVEEPVRQRAGPSVVQVDMAPERMSDVFSRIDRLFTVRGSQKRRVKISEARPLIEEAESEKLLSDENVIKEAIEATESAGIVVLDELDKVCSPGGRSNSADASAEGVQRDLLPLIEGTVVPTKHGNVKTDHILFVAAGAFHTCKPSDLMAELIGRLPIRVELNPLSKSDLRRILTEPENNLIRQQVELLATEGVDLVFTDAAIDKIAHVTADVNQHTEDIGARRLHTVIERIVEDVSFNAPALKGQKVTVDAVQVEDALGDLLVKSDLSRFIL